MQPRKICICLATCPYLGKNFDHPEDYTNCLPGNGENGTVGFVLRYNVRGGPGGGEHHDGGGLALVRRQHSTDRRRRGVVETGRLLLALLLQKGLYTRVQVELQANICCKDV